MTTSTIGLAASAPTSPDTRPIAAVRISPARLMKRAERESNKLLRRIERALERDDTATARHLQRVYLKSRAAKRAAVTHAGNKLRQKGKSYVEGQAALDLADSLSVVQAPAETVRAFPVRKKRPGEFRAIHEFGQADRARQYMVAKVIEPLANVTARQHGTKNGGRNEAVRIIAEAIADPAYKWAATADIRNFFPSINREWLKANLPVGPEITSSTLLVDDDDRYRRFQWDGCGLSSPCTSSISLWSASRRGLPQGASSSPLIAEYLIARVLETVRFAPGVIVENCHDNFVIVGRLKADVEQALVDLRGAFERHPAGDFLITDDGVRRICDGIEFLGYRMRRKRGSLPIMPTAENMQAFEKKFARHVVGVLRDVATAPKLRAYVRTWRSAFRHFGGAAFFTHMAIGKCARAFPAIKDQLDWCSADHARAVKARFGLVG